MMKWVLGLCASIYVTLLVFGGAPNVEETETIAALTSQDATAEVETAAASAETEVQTVKIAAPSGGSVDLALAAPTTPAPLALPVVQVAAIDSPNTIEPSAIEAPQAQIIPAAVIETPPSEAAPTNGVGEIWSVTGSTVNLRSEPGTYGDVLGQTRRGNSAEVIELLDNGWAKVFILESGLEAYMSADYLRRSQRK